MEYFVPSVVMAVAGSDDFAAMVDGATRTDGATMPDDSMPDGPAGTGLFDGLPAPLRSPVLEVAVNQPRDLAMLSGGVATPPKMLAADLGRQHREPTASETAAFKELQDVATWAKVKGLVDFRPSMLGSLLHGLGFDPDADIGEFASLDLPTLTEFLRNQWEYTLKDSETNFSRET